jgi:hypothetical protein
MGLLHSYPGKTCLVLLVADAQQKQHHEAAVAGVPALLLLMCQTAYLRR